MRVLISLLAVFSLSSCGVSRPDIYLCGVNAQKKYLRCFNFRDDYNDDGSLKAGAKPTLRPVPDLAALDKAFVIDSKTGYEDALAGLKTYVKQLRDHYANCQAGN